MDPFTHAIIGISLSKLAGNGTDISNPAVLGMVVGSVFPDIDIVLQKWGDYVYLKNHRGATHSILGMIVSSALIALGFMAIYGSKGYITYFLWIFAGCMSHTLIDLFNSYGAKVFWPFNERKFSFSLLIIFDPVFIGILTLYIFSKGKVQYILLALTVLYLLSRVLMRLCIVFHFKRNFGKTYKKISILPSMAGLLSWHFILESSEYKLIGEKSILKRNVRVFKKLDKTHDIDLDEALISPVGRFFREFTPLYHIIYEKGENIRRYTFIDLRYYIKNKFLHHAILEVDELGNAIKSSFNPYSIKRANQMPLE